MKKVFIAILMAVAVVTLGCSHHGGDEPAVELCPTCYIVSDYEGMIDLYSEFHYLETHIHFDKTVDSLDALVDTVVNYFQVGDTTVVITHTMDYDDTVYVKCRWSGSLELNPYMDVNFDSCMVLVSNVRSQLHTHYVCLRRPYTPPVPDNGLWIFGNGLYIIDSETGKPVETEQNRN